ncbi:MULTISPECIES: alpha/beta fold hydrolase [Vibrio]|uniref:Alpha/beta hydrolase n=1 Tax=Vibrio casei TaxID=673372 RepID=A0A368LNB9_9VIBR|nr:MULTISPECIES: alpha/beta hydrolase [Vibrio]RCS73389.1 alpha/beta hydrolase [Vibrio casei]SJN17364.1 Beta-ketoadipate enol-lactone hydrolase, putative [Vibrio casei]HBV75866.1 alpha/beta hydrolase [Vibrio sp.]
MNSDILFHKTYHHPTSNEWVVFVHGAGGSSSLWFKQIKDYRQHFNLLLIDLRGHGRSNQLLKNIISKHYSFEEVTMDILRVLDHLKIQSAHFVGMSLGTILVRNLAEMASNRVDSMVLGGAITRLDIRSQVLVKAGDMCKHIIPYMWLYKLFAYVVMPQRSQKESRHLFIHEAKKLCQKEFKRWFKLAADVNPMMKYFREREIAIPTLYLMGELDYMFIHPVKEMVSKHRSSWLLEIPNCGHVCNVERPQEFNNYSIKFIQKHSK